MRRSWDMTTPSCWATRPITRALATSRFGIQSPFDVPDENYMAFDLSGRHPQMSGQVEYPPQF